MKRLSLSPFVLMFTLTTSSLALSSSSSFGFSHQQSHHQQQQQQQLFSHQPQQELVPSANIFTPAWLAQRRSRHLGNSGSSPNIYAFYQQPQQQQQFSYQQHYQPQTTSSHYLATPNLGRGSPLPMFHMVPPSQPQIQPQQQYYQPSFDSMPHHGRFSPVYYHPPTTSAGTTFYLAPVVHVPAAADQGDHHHHHHQISKRVDHHQQQFLKPLSSEHVKHAKPCSSSSSSSSIPLPSEQYPVYVLPPKNFQPIIYHHPQQQQQQAYHPSQGVTKTAEELWYESNDNAGKVKYGNGGKHGTTEGNSLESSSRPSPSNEFRKIYLVPVTADQVGGQNSFPVYEAVIREVATAVDAKPVPVTNAFNSQIERLPHPQQQQQQQLSNDQPEKVGVDQRRPLKTKLPVGLTSFFLGGVRGVSGRHWAMPPALVKDLEFMPNGSPMSPENKYLPEESYVKKVDNGGGSGDSSVASAGDPEKEDSVVAATVSAGNKSRNQATGGNKKKGIFESGNTIIDSPLDLETAESSSSFSSSVKQVISVVPSSSTSIAKSWALYQLNTKKVLNCIFNWIFDLVAFLLLFLSFPFFLFLLVPSLRHCHYLLTTPANTHILQ